MNYILTILETNKTNGVIEAAVQDFRTGEVWQVVLGSEAIKSLKALCLNYALDLKKADQLVGMTITSTMEENRVFPLRLLREKRTPAPILQDSKNEPKAFKKALEILNTEDLKAAGLGCDYAWRNSLNKLCLVERKDVDDLVSSIVDGRLRTELADISRVGADIGFLLVEGWMGLDIQTGRPITFRTRKARRSYASRSYNQVWSAVATFQAYYPRLIIWPSPGSYATPSILLDMYKWSDTTEHKSIQEALIDIAYAPGLSKQEVMLLALPGIGSKTSQALLEHFGSLLAIFNATEKELKQVRGVGKKVAASMKSFLLGEKTYEAIEWEIDTEKILKETLGALKE